MSERLTVLPNNLEEKLHYRAGVLPSGEVIGGEYFNPGESKEKLLMQALRCKGYHPKGCIPISPLCPQLERNWHRLVTELNFNFLKVPPGLSQLTEDQINWLRHNSSGSKVYFTDSVIKGVPLVRKNNYPLLPQGDDCYGKPTCLSYLPNPCGDIGMVVATTGATKRAEDDTMYNEEPLADNLVGAPFGRMYLPNNNGMDYYSNMRDSVGLLYLATQIQRERFGEDRFSQITKALEAEYNFYTDCIHEGRTAPYPRPDN